MNPSAYNVIIETLKAENFKRKETRKNDKWTVINIHSKASADNEKYKKKRNNYWSLFDSEECEETVVSSSDATWSQWLGMLEKWRGVNGPGIEGMGEAAKIVIF